MNTNTKQKITELLIHIVAAELVGALSALFTGGYNIFFSKYEKPPLMPPSWLFPATWVLLYAVMGISAYLVISRDSTQKTRRAMYLYYAQLAVNFSWSIIFFRFELLWTGFFVIVLLTALLCAMIISFCKVKPLAGLINLPYLLWLIFAGYLNLATAIIN